MEPLIERLTTDQGDILVTTKKGFYFFFNRPRTYVIPEGFSKFGTQLGFQVRYNTNDESILRELHSFFVASVIVGEFQSLLDGAKKGLINFSEGYEHLRPYIIGFHI